VIAQREILCLAIDGQCLLVVLNGLASLAELSISNPKVAQSSGFAASIANLTRDDQGLLVTIHGLADLTEVSVAVSQVIEPGTLTPTVVMAPG
jgi:hypothetical protein